MVMKSIRVIMNIGIYIVLLLTRFGTLGLIWVCEFVNLGIYTFVLLTGFPILVTDMVMKGIHVIMNVGIYIVLLLTR